MADIAFQIKLSVRAGVGD